MLPARSMNRLKIIANRQRRGFARDVGFVALLVLAASLGIAVLATSSGL